MTQRYTVDASALIYFAVGRLPDPAIEAFRAAVDGEVTLELPVIAAVEAMYVIDRRDSVQNTEIPIGAEEALAAFESLPVTVVDTTHADASKSLDQLDAFPAQMHDALIVASHETRDTDAIVTSDDAMAEQVPTVWD